MEDDRLLSHFGVTSMNTLYCNLYLRLFKIHSWQNAERYLQPVVREPPVVRSHVPDGPRASRKNTKKRNV